MSNTTLTVSSKTRYLYAPPPENAQAFAAAVQTARDNALPFLRDFTVDERKSQSKLGADADGFLADGRGFVQTHPQFAPAFVDIPRCLKTLDACDQLEEQLLPLMELVRFMQDSIMCMRTDAFGDMRAYYKAVKIAAEMGEPGAEPVALRLGKMFANFGPKPGAAEDAEPAPEGAAAPAPAAPAAG